MLKDTTYTLKDIETKVEHFIDDDGESRVRILDMGGEEMVSMNKSEAIDFLEMVRLCIDLCDDEENDDGE